MRYYVTGSNGFIGRHVVKYLQERGHDVYKVSRPIVGQWLSTDHISFKFVHLSAYGNHYNQKDISQIISSNIFDLAYLIDYFKDTTCEKFYNVSTSSIQLEKQTLYSLSKHFGEILVNNTNDQRFVNIRPFSVYGPGEADHRFIPTVIRALHSGETIQLDLYAKHDWIFVDDFIQAMFDGHKNIGTGFQYRNIDIVNMLEEIAGKKLSYTEAKLRNYDTDNWVCKTPVPHRSIFEGLKQTYEYYARTK